MADVKYMGSNVSDWIGNLLLHEGFGHIPGLQEGILVIVDTIRSYAEERVRLVPEILISTNLEEVLKPVPSVNQVVIGNQSISRNSFQRALKLCAPLATEGWVIFMELENGQIRYGLISAETSVFNLSLRGQLVGETAEGTRGPIAFIRALGSKAVEIKGTNTHLIISVSITETEIEFEAEMDKLVTALVGDIEEGVKPTTKIYFRKLLEEATNESHGCIVAIIQDQEQIIKKFRDTYPDGVYLLEPIDLAGYVKEVGLSGDTAAYMFLRTYGIMIKRMIGFDGITLLTTKGRVCGYNIFVPVTKVGGDTDLVGGARTRAFRTLTDSSLARFCLFRSEDGKTECWECGHE